MYKTGLKISLLLVDDHPLISLGIRHSLEQNEHIGEIVAARTAAEAIQYQRTRPFDLYIVDVELPDMSGYELIGRIRMQDADARIIVNTMHSEVWTINHLLQCGVNGVVIKTSDAAELNRAVEKVAIENRNYYCPCFEQLRKCLQRNINQEFLTQRELDVLEAIAAGHNTSTIARLLKITDNTIETHRKHLFAKLGAQNSVDLVMRALARGIISVDKVGQTSAPPAAAPVAKRK